MVKMINDGKNEETYVLNLKSGSNQGFSFNQIINFNYNESVLFFIFTWFGSDVDERALDRLLILRAELKDVFRFAKIRFLDTFDFDLELFLHVRNFHHRLAK